MTVEYRYIFPDQLADAEKRQSDWVEERMRVVEFLVKDIPHKHAMHICLAAFVLAEIGGRKFILRGLGHEEFSLFIREPNRQFKGSSAEKRLLLWRLHQALAKKIGESIEHDWQREVSPLQGSLPLLEMPT